MTTWLAHLILNRNILSVKLTVTLGRDNGRLSISDRPYSHRSCRFPHANGLRPSPWRSMSGSAQTTGHWMSNRRNCAALVRSRSSCPGMNPFTGEVRAPVRGRASESPGPSDQLDCVIVRPRATLAVSRTASRHVNSGGGLHAPGAKGFRHGSIISRRRPRTCRVDGEAESPLAGSGTRRGLIPPIPRADRSAVWCIPRRAHQG